MSAVLEAEGLQTYYGKSHILHGVSLKVNQGELIALLGRNGAGKTTTMRSVMGLTPPRDGNIKLFGKDVTKAASHRIANAGVGYVPEGRKIFGHMTVHENLLVPPETKGPWTIETIYKLFPRLEERKTSKGGRLSGGEQEMLAIARALLLNPKFLILDEPSQGLAPVIVQEVMRTIHLALQLADRAYVLSDGEVAYDGSAAELGADTERMEHLAGVSHVG
ncbi:MAG: ABC transporter ATP-binding protein [Acidiphilium sp. 37-67-22]|nr:MAG: ABC transporter ATP-binding protein [Acidiphilium sp. 37-67-22]